MNSTVKLKARESVTISAVTGEQPAGGGPQRHILRNTREIEVSGRPHWLSLTLYAVLFATSTILFRGLFDEGLTVRSGVEAAAGLGAMTCAWFFSGRIVRLVVTAAERNIDQAEVTE